VESETVLVGKALHYFRSHFCVLFREFRHPQQNLAKKSVGGIEENSFK
jgi:hypothetical protein